MAELAARLGSIVTFDRRGNVLFLEDFQGSLAKFGVGTTGSGGSVSISSERARHGSFSCKMVTGDATDNEAYIWAFLAYPVLSRIGVEFSWLPKIWLRDIELNLWFYDSINYWKFLVRWHVDDDTWQYFDDIDGWTALSPPVLHSREDYLFTHTKLVIDLNTKEYVRLIVNNRTWDLTGEEAWSDVAEGEEPRLYFDITLYTRANFNAITYLGSLIITQNEP